jgi:hypothetical protein
MSWPKALEHVTIHELRCKNYKWDLHRFQSMLGPHKASLQSIRLGSMSQHGNKNLDLSSYPKLETVQLSYWATSCSLGSTFT